jgi:hypothetical protein
VTPLVGSSTPGAVTAQTRAKQSSDNPAANLLLSLYGALPAPASDGLALQSDSTNPFGYSWQAGSRPPLVAALPGAPTDQQEVYYQADAANGIIWHLRYNAGSASAYKWEILGSPPPLFSEVVTLETLATINAYTALTTAGPSLTLPLAGDYDVHVGARALGNAASALQRMSFDIAGVAAVDADAASATSAGAGSDSYAEQRYRRKTGLAAATVLLAKYKTTVAGGGWAERFLRATPIRVSG